MVFTFGSFELDEDLYELRRAGTKVPTQPKVLELLLLLVKERVRVVPKREIFERLWPDAVVSDASLARATLEARRAIGDEAQQQIVTVRGRGLRFVAEVAERRGSAPHRVSAHDEPAAPSGGDVYVGRDDVDAELRARLEAAAAGQGSVVWLTGEAGIGRTRATDELTRVARGRGATVLTGRAHETLGAPQYWVWLQVARALMATFPAPAAAAFAKEVAPLLPELVAPEPPPPSAADEGVRFRLYDVFTQKLAAPLGAGAGPLIIVLEDLHWADPASLQLLRFFARAVRDAHVLVIATARDTPIDASERGRELSALLSEHAADVLPLRALSEADVARLAEAVTGKQPDATLAAKLRAKSGGNPAYVQQLLRTEWARGALEAASTRDVKSSIDLQPGLVQSIARHTGGLSERCRSILTVAAVMGSEVDLPRLAAAVGATPESLLDALEEAQRARVLVKSTLSRYAFTHALVRDVLYKAMPPAERLAMHRRVADALVAHYGATLDEHLAEVASHLVRAAPGGDAERAVAMATRAAERASAAGSAKAAASLYEQALEALSFAAPEDATRAEALRARAAEARALAKKTR
jgi:predicted ATPase/DNA-binding winged helix-turn-helix (wHTH) protein